MTQMIIEIPEALVNKVVAVLCHSEGLEPTGANAKKVVAQLIRQKVTAQLIAEAQQKAQAEAPEGIQ